MSQITKRKTMTERGNSSSNRNNNNSNKDVECQHQCCFLSVRPSSLFHTRTGAMVLIWNCLSVVHKGRTNPDCHRAIQQMVNEDFSVSGLWCNIHSVWLFCLPLWLCSLNNWSACNEIAVFIFVVMAYNQRIKCSNRNRMSLQSNMQTMPITYLSWAWAWASISKPHRSCSQLVFDGCVRNNFEPKKE